MKILGLNISRDTPEKEPTTAENIANLPPIVADSAKNGWEDSAAGQLQRSFRRSSVKIDGRTVGEEYDEETIKQIYKGYIFGAIKKTRNRVADILENNVEFYNPNDGSSRKAPALEDQTHPYYQKIQNGEADVNAFFAGIATYYLILGEVFVFTGERLMLAGNIKDNESFELLQSNRIKRIYNVDAETLKAYRLKIPLANGTDRYQYYLPENIIEIRDLNPWELRKGYGTIRPVLDEIGLENTATRLQTATLANGFKAPGMISSKETLGVAQFEDLLHNVDARYTSNDMSKAGTPIVSNGGTLNYTSLLEDFDKLAMQKIRSMNLNAFLAALSVSKTILGIEESGTTRETSNIQFNNFILDACMPVANAILAAFNQDYVKNHNAEYLRKPIKMRAVAPLAKDLEQEKAEAEINKQKAETFKIYREAKVEANQAAKLSGIELEKDETIQIDSVAISNDDATEQITAPPADQTGADDEETTNGTKPHIHSENCSHDPKKQGQAAELAKNSVNSTDLAKIEKAEAKFAKELRNLESGLADVYIKQLDSINTMPDDDRDEYMELLVGILLSYYLVVMPIFGKNRATEVAADFGLPTAGFVLSANAIDQIKQRLSMVATGRFRTVDEEISKIIRDGVNNGLPRATIAQQIRNTVANDVAGWQVDRLVTTETANAFRQSQWWADKMFIERNGFVGKAYKVWTTNSSNPCPFCDGLAGRRVPFEDNFYNVGDSVEAVEHREDGTIKQSFYPVRFVDISDGGLHPNCHCTYRLEIDND